jgi:hypothetical protein
MSSIIKSGNVSSGLELISAADGKLTLQSGLTPADAITLDENQNVNIPKFGIGLKTLGQGNATSFKNRIINGAMNINQRGTINVAAASVTYGLDRFYLYTAGSTGQISKTPVSGEWGNYVANFTVSSTGNTVFNFGQRIEAANIADLAGKTVTLSFYMASTAPVSGNIVYMLPGGIDNYSSFTVGTIAAVTNTSGSYIKQSFTFTLPAGATNGVGFEFQSANLANLANGTTIRLTGVQLEEGSQATSLEMRDIGTELSLCQRYYVITHGAARSNATGAGQYFDTNIYFPVSMRASPTVTTTGGSTNNIQSSGTAEVNNMNVRFEIISLAAGDCYAISSVFTASAEL